MAISKNPSEVAARFAAKHQSMVQKSGAMLRNHALGNALAELLEKGEDPSIENLKKVINLHISASSSARGEIDIKDDLARSPFEFALALLNSRNDA